MSDQPVTSGPQFRWTGTANTNTAGISAGWSESLAQFAQGVRRFQQEMARINNEIAERKQPVSNTQQAETHHVSPKHGAYVRKIGGNIESLQTFDVWVDKDHFKVGQSEDPVVAVEYEALVPAHHSLGYSRAAGMPNSGHPGHLCMVTGWRTLNPLVRLHDTSSSSAWGANTVAGLMPVLNPQFESLKHKAERLEREMALLQFGLHARMVAEGVARSWCEEFDPILDSTGLPPRKGKGIILGTMTFKTALSGYDVKDPAILEQIKARPWDFIPTRDIRITLIEADPEPMGPMLS